MRMVQLKGVEPGSSVQTSRALWTWASSDAPIQIEVALDAVSKLRSELEQAASRAEIGGVLLGCAGKTPATIEIHDYLLLPPDPNSAGDYCLDLAQLERVRYKHSDLFVVGYFRTQSEGALHLRRPEINLVAEHFHDPTDVVMLIRTSPHQFRAGFLFWDGDVFLPFSIQDFPFDVASLAGNESEPPKIAFSPAMEPRVTRFTTLRESPMTPMLGAEVGPPAKTNNVRRNVLAACAGVAALVGLSLFVLRDDLPFAPKASQAAVRPVDSPSNVATQVSPQTAAERAPAVPPVAERAAVATPPSVQRQSIPVSSTLPRGAATDVRARAVRGSTPDRRVVPIPAPPPRLPPAPVALALTTERAPTLPPAPIPPVAPAPALSTGDQSPSIPANAAAVTPQVPAPRENAAEVVPVKASDPPATRPAAPVVPSRFAGAWSYPMNNGLYHGSQPEVVEVVIQETNGRLSGTAYARFKSSAAETARTLRFQFSGDLRAGRSQAFNLEAVDGARGSVELIPGTSPNLLELNFRTTPEGGNGQTGNMILLKK